MRELVSPNWHVAIMHYPIALVTMGMLIELFSFRWRNTVFHQSGRWMVLLGALLAVPTALAGAYAFRDVVVPGPLDLDQPWNAVAAQSPWTAAQWSLMEDHIWYNSGATVLLVLISVVYLASNERVRPKLFWPLLIALIVGDGLIAMGAWHGGEAVYEHGTAVQANVPIERPATIQTLIPAIEAHVILAGLVGASVFLALGLTIRRWQATTAIVPIAPQPNAVDRPFASVLPGAPAMGVVPAAGRPAGERVCQPLYMSAGRFWILGTILGLATAIFGIWSVAGGFTGSHLKAAYEETVDPANRRLLVHVVCGVSLVVLTVLVAALVRFATMRRVLTGIGAGLVVLLVACQIWLGVAMLFDSPSGPLLQFNSGTKVEHTTMRGGAEPGAEATRMARSGVKP